MLRRTIRMLRSRVARTFGVAMLIAAAWAGWWIAPPWSEVRLIVTVPNLTQRCIVTADGRTLVVESQQERHKPDNENESLYRADLYELPSGQHLATLNDATPGYLCSPDGSKLAWENLQGQWHFNSLPAGEPLPSPQDSEFGTGEWSPNGRYFLIYDDEHIVVVDANTGELAVRIKTAGKRGILFADGSGLAALAADQKHIDVWSFDPPRLVDSLELPYPLAGDFHGMAPPPAGSMLIETMAANSDGSEIVANIVRFEPEGDGLAMVGYLECWGRRTSRRIEVATSEAGLAVAPSLNVSDDGRLVARILSGWFPNSGNASWLRSRPQSAVTTILWDISAEPARCFNNAGLPANQGIHLFGQRILTSGADKATLFDQSNLTPLSTFVGMLLEDVLSCDRPKKWIAVRVRYHRFEWLPKWVPDQFVKMLRGAEASVCVVRLNDGALCRSLANRDSPSTPSLPRAVGWSRITVTSTRVSGRVSPSASSRWRPAKPITCCTRVARRLA